MSDPLQSLRNLKTPLWSRLLGYYRARQALKAALKREHLVAYVTHWSYFNDAKRWTFQIYYCFKRGDGRKRYEYVALDSFMAYQEKRNAMYTHGIKLWLEGVLSDATLKDWQQQTRRCPEKTPS